MAEEKWAVLVVHGVGNTRPGATVDALVSSLAATNPNVRPDGNIEVLQLPDKDVRWLIENHENYPTHRQRTPAKARDRLLRAPRMLTTFPMHFRRAALKVNHGPREAIFAEVYWADLSKIREGTLSLILSLLGTVFSLRHIMEQAVNNIEWWGARWMRTIVYISAWWLCGPIAALYGFMLYVLTSYYLLVFPLKQPSRPNGPISPVIEDWWLFVLTVIALLASAVAWIFCRWNNSGSTWTRLWASFLVVSAVGFAGAIAAILEWPAGVGQWRLVQFLREGAEHRLHNTLPPKGRILGCVAWLLYILDLNLALLGYLLLLGFVFWLCVRLFTSQGKGDNGPALDAAYGAALAQGWLWLLVMPSVTLVAVRTFLRDQVAAQVFEFLASISLFLTLNVFFSGGFILIGGIVVWLRWLWTVNNPQPYSFPPAVRQREIPRLIINSRILLALVLVSVFVLADYLFPLQMVRTRSSSSGSAGSGSSMSSRH